MNQVRNPADILLSFKPGYYHGIESFRHIVNLRERTEGWKGRDQTWFQSWVQQRGYFEGFFGRKLRQINDRFDRCKPDALTAKLTAHVLS
jgi:hypothetical protein